MEVIEPKRPGCRKRYGNCIVQTFVEKRDVLWKGHDINALKKEPAARSPEEAALEDSELANIRGESGSLRVIDSFSLHKK